MAKYIDVEKLIESTHKKFNSAMDGADFAGVCALQGLNQMVLDLCDKQAIVDAVEVVRCKDCKFYHKQECAMDDWHFSETKEEDFCSFAERKEK